MISSWWYSQNTLLRVYGCFGQCDLDPLDSANGSHHLHKDNPNGTHSPHTHLCSHIASSSFRGCTITGKSQVQVVPIGIVQISEMGPVSVVQMGTTGTQLHWRKHAYAIQENRLIVTYNAKDFRRLAQNSKKIGVIGVSALMPYHHIDNKLTSLLINSSPNALQGTYTALSEAA